MSLLSDLLVRARALFLGRREDREMDDEVRFHLERDAEERIRNGQAPEAARRDALLAFGGVERYKEQARDARPSRSGAPSRLVDTPG